MAKADKSQKQYAESKIRSISNERKGIIYEQANKLLKEVGARLYDSQYTQSRCYQPTVYEVRGCGYSATTKAQMILSGQATPLQDKILSQIKKQIQDKSESTLQQEIHLRDDVRDFYTYPEEAKVIAYRDQILNHIATLFKEEEKKAEAAIDAIHLGDSAELTKIITEYAGEDDKGKKELPWPKAPKLSVKIPE